MNPIEKTEGPCIILAGAGTGKTYTIVEKLKHVIDNKIYEPKKIACITFSNEAANNLLSRVQKFINLNEDPPTIKTFHSFSADLLRKYGAEFGIKEDFKILDSDQAKVVLHKYFNKPVYQTKQHISEIGTAKDLGISLEEIESFLAKKLEKYKDIDLKKELENIQFSLQTLHLKEDNSMKKALTEKFESIKEISDLKDLVNSWNCYEKIKTKRNYLDYSDLNSLALKVLKKNPQVSKEFDYIIVDEFQDTNKLQVDFIFALTPHRNITIVGDLNQSIYRFRGAYRKNYEDFKKLFDVSDEDIFELDTSYRSTNKILRVSHKLILNNYENKKECFEVESAFGLEGEKLEVFELNNPKEEARKVADLVDSEIKKGTNIEEICVLFRNHNYGKIIKQALESKGISYVSTSNKSLLKQRIVKIVVDYLIILNCLINDRSGGEQAWWDLVYNLDFNEDDLIEIGKYIKEFKEKNRETEKLSISLLSELPKIKLSDIGEKEARGLTERLNFLKQMENKNITEILERIFSSLGFSKEEDDSESTLNLNNLYEIAKEYSNLYEPDLGSFVHYLDILNNLSIEIPASEIEKKGVRLMTLHATKGLEFKTVIVTNMAEKRFPVVKLRKSLIPTELNPESSKLEDLYDLEKQNQLYEERRLCYVAFTRAKEKLILTYAKEYSGKDAIPSTFLKEIDFKNNEDIEFSIDSEDKFEEPEPTIKSASEISSFIYSKNLKEKLSEELKNRKEKIVFEKSFSPSSLLLFDDCQKKFEYKYVYKMPDEKIVAWESVILGKFIHKVLEHGVKSGFLTLKEFIDHARELSMEKDWEPIDFAEAEQLISVFFARNHGKYSENSETEKYLDTELNGLRFRGFADRIDFTDNGLRIVDYKTSKSPLPPKNRNWQLGYYALAAAKLGKVTTVSLEMLRQEKPLEFEIDDRGLAVSKNGRMQFNIYEVKDELIKTAEEIERAYKHGFQPCPVEKNCEFCEEYVYNLKGKN